MTSFVEFFLVGLEGERRNIWPHLPEWPEALRSKLTAAWDPNGHLHTNADRIDEILSEWEDQYLGPGQRALDPIVPRTVRSKVYSYGQ